MRRLSKVVNIVPVIAKADTLTLEERDDFKQTVRGLCFCYCGCTKKKAAGPQSKWISRPDTQWAPHRLACVHFYNHRSVRHEELYRALGQKNITEFTVIFNVH